MYEVGTAISVRAFHVMPGMEGPEGERHSHDYKIELLVERSEVDERGMVCDLDVLDDVLRRTADRVCDADLETMVPFGPADGVTVEAFARWVHSAVADSARRAGAEVLAVRVWESKEAFGGFRASLI
ncbi:MAG TPA: 6-carboxytetrahydropterin synthase [Acidimicrobiales bacterium]|nr:6-carboxytetrahydropterin synthase [Acidimicrobiales bacterium]